MERMVLLKYF